MWGSGVRVPLAPQHTDRCGLAHNGLDRLPCNPSRAPVVLTLSYCRRAHRRRGGRLAQRTADFLKPGSSDARSHAHCSRWLSCPVPPRRESRLLTRSTEPERPIKLRLQALSSTGYASPRVARRSSARIASYLRSDESGARSLSRRVYVAGPCKVSTTLDFYAKVIPSEQGGERAPLPQPTAPLRKA